MIQYINGNYTVIIHDDGTKIRQTVDEEFRPTNPETIDINISNKCSNNCKYCYINASSKGKHGDLRLQFFDTIKPFTEIAINYSEHPDLLGFLIKMNLQKIIVNMTVNYKDIIDDFKFKELYDYQRKGLIKSIGVSIDINYNISQFIQVNNKMYSIPRLIELRTRQLKHVVLHFVLGILSIHDILSWKNKDRKILLLGYKSKGRGKKYISKNNYIEKNIAVISNDKAIDLIFKSFKVVSFDNLAVDQLNMKEKLTKEQWNELYIGNDGNFSFYIDTVTNTYNISSRHSNWIRKSIKNKSVKEMFIEIKRRIK